MSISQKHFLLIICIFPIILFSQVPKRPNVYDAKGQRTGEWAILYDSAFQNIIEEENEAVYFCLMEFKEGNPRGRVECFYRSGIKQWEGNMYSLEPQKKHGPATFYHPNGNIHSKVIYRNDTLHGTYISYHDNGMLESQGEISFGDRKGYWEYFHNNGTLLGMGSYTDGKENGIWEIYHTNGQLSGKGNFKAGEYDGYWEHLYPSGGLMSKGKYVGGQYEVLWYFYYENGNLAKIATYHQGIYNGPVTLYHENGNFETVGAYTQGNAHGDFTYYHDNGAVESKGEIVNGLFEGDWINYYPSGTIKSQGPFKNDLNHGYWKYYNEAGQLSSECNLTMGNWDGIARFYHENGQVSATGAYRNDLKHDAWLYFNASGTKTGLTTYTDDVMNGPMEKYSDDGVLLQKGNLVNELREGEWTYFHANGQLHYTGNFKADYGDGFFTYFNAEGQKIKEGLIKDAYNEGPWVFFFDNGNVKNEGEYSEGNRIGWWKYYHENGRLSSEGDYANGESTGLWKYYYENGTLKKEGKEQNDMLYGLWSYWDDKGRQESLGYWENNLKSGKWTFFDTLGQVSQIDDYINDKLLNFNNLYDSAVSVATKGDFELAQKIIKEAEKRFKDGFSSTDVKRADVYGLHAQYWNAKKDYKKALMYYQKALDHVKKSQPDTSSWYTNYLRDKGEVYWAQRDYTNAITVFKQVLDLIKERPFGRESTDYSYNIRNLGYTLRDAGKVSEAFELLNEEQQYQIQNTRQKRNVPANFISLINFGYDLDRYVETMLTIKQLIAFNESNGLTEDWTYPTAFYYKGLVHNMQEEYDSAAMNFEKAIALFEATGSDSYLYINSLLKLGDHYYADSYYGKSGTYFRRAIQLCLDFNYQDIWVYRQAVLAMGKQLWGESLYEDALSYYREAVRLLESVGEKDTNLLSQAYLGVAICLETLGPTRRMEAEPMFHKAISVVANEPVFSNDFINSNLHYSEFLLAEAARQHEAISLLHRMIIYNLGFEQPSISYLSSTYYYLGKTFYKQQKFDSSLFYLNKCIAIYDELGENFQIYQESIRLVSDVLEDLEKFEEAQVYNFKALAAVENYMGKENTFYANILSDIASNHALQENYKSAIPYYNQSLEIKEKLLGKQHENYLSTLVNLGEKLNDDQQYKEGLETLLRAKGLYESKNSTSNSAYIRCLFEIVEAYESNKRTAEAESTALLALKMSKQIFGTNHERYAEHMRYTAQFYSRQGKYDEAYLYIRPAIELVEKLYGKTIKYAWYAGTLSWIEYNRGYYPHAVALREEAVQIYFNQARESDDYMNALFSLAEIYRSLGQFQNSVDTYLQTVDIVSKKYGNFSYAMTSPLTELGATYWRWEKPAKSMEYYQRVEELYDSLGVKRYNYPALYNMMGLAKYDFGQYADAKKLYESAIQITDSIYGSGIGSIYYSNNLAFCYMMMGDFPQAEKLWLQSGAVMNVSTQDDLTRVLWLDNMATLYQAWDKLDKAEKYWTETNQILLTRIKRDFPFLSESGKAAFWDAYKKDFEYFNSYVLKAKAIGNTKAIEQMYDNQLQTKSILLSTSSKERRRILSSGDSTLVNNYLNYIRLKEDLAKYYGYSKDQLLQENISIPDLEKEAGRYEKVLSLDASALKNEEKEKAITWKSIQRALKPGEAAVEIIRFRYFDRILTDSIIYAALILTPETKSAPKLVVIPNGGELEAKYVRGYKSSIQFQVEDRSSYTHFWAVIDKELSGAKKVYLSPDAVYNQINISTLQRPDGAYIRDQYSIRLLTSTRDITMLKAPSVKAAKPTAFLFGFPQYNLAHADIGYTLQERAIQKSTDSNLDRDVDLSRFGFSELPGTKIETESIHKLLEDKQWETSLYLSDKALEEELKAVSNPTLLHVATHGFFLDDIEDNSGGMTLGVSMEVGRANPLLRSGLLMAGAAQTAQGMHDVSIDNGIFTAYEAMNLNLTGTELVVLSACETGRGEIKNGEGVYGLQRAFQIAGAKSIMMSLWKVNDAATQLLMTTFYKSWLSGKTKDIALQNAQDAVKAEFPHPYYWGAFVLVGE